MKKIFFSLAAIVALFATSCVTEVASDVRAKNELCDVTFALQSANVATRAGEPTIGNGLKASELTYAVYDANWEYLTMAETTFPTGQLSTTITLRLVKGKTYNFVFWAQSPEAKANNYYTLTLGSTVGDIVNPSVKVNYDATKDLANDDTRDAFFGQRLALRVDGTINETIYLKRPFAQINFGTSDTADAKLFGFDVALAETVSSIVTSAYQTLYLKDGSLGDDLTPVTFKANALPVDTTLKTNKGDYYWLATCYILWPKTEDNNPTSIPNTTLSINTQNHSVSVEVPMAPAQRNWRTNLVGDILTEKGNLTVEIVPEFEDATNPDNQFTQDHTTL